MVNGRITGQINTANFIIKILIEEIKKENFILLKQPHFSKFIFIDWIRYIIKNITVSIFFKIDTVYIVANRTRKSFLLRDLYPILIAYFKKSKTIYHVVGNDFLYFFNSLSTIEKKLLTLSFKSNNFIFAVLGNGMERSIRKALDINNNDSSSIKFIHLPAFVSDKDVLESKKYFNNILYDDNVTIGFMSNLIIEKGYNYFLEAFIKFSEKFPRCICWVAGPKYEHENYNKLDELIESGRIQYYPYLNGVEKWKILGETNVFILPTFYKTEYLPLSIVDAMLCGCYVISCDTGDISKYIKKFNGVLVPHENSDGICEALINYTNISPKNNRVNIRDYVINTFSERIYRKKLLELCRDI